MDDTLTEIHECSASNHTLDTKFIITTTLLAVLNLIVLMGNSLVVIAVFTNEKLRTVTNSFILSLAIADLCVGILVLPFIIANEVMTYWIFGPLWCSIWLAIDVWMCTASIYSLVAISFDRYLAISEPFKYHTTMTRKRSYLLVAIVWIVSFVICFPPLIGWNERGVDITHLNEKMFKEDIYPLNSSFHSTDNTIVSEYKTFTNDRNITSNIDLNSTVDCFPICELTSDPGYVVYSACGSFYVPMIIMVFFYWRIYLTAVGKTRSLKTGILKMKTKSILDEGKSDQFEMRVHRGRRLSHDLSYAYKSSNSNKSRMRKDRDTLMKYKGGTKLKRNATIECSSSFSVHSNGTDASEFNNFLKTHRCNPKNRNDAHLSKFCSGTNISRDSQCDNRFEKKDCNFDSFSEREDDFSKLSFQTRMLKKSKSVTLKTHLRRLNKEKKAAKTVGIIIGCFICCWMPFFTIYLIGAFCENCIPNMYFTIIFWLGYVNSAINPFIYGLLSKEFKTTFKHLLGCACVIYKKRKYRNNLNTVLYSTYVLKKKNLAHLDSSSD